jgi:GntR family transcriptional regulator
MVTVNGQQSLWESLAARLRDDITSGVLKPGAKIPTEEWLQDTYKLSRTTVRKALGKLTNEGLITEGAGKQGRRVTDRRPVEMPFAQSETQERAERRREQGIDAWMADVADQGRKASQNLKVSTEPASARVGALLGIPEGAPVVERRHVRTVDEEPNNLSSTYYERELVKDTPIMDPYDIPGGVILWMRDNMGIRQEWFRYEFEARMPTPEEARELRIPSGIPVLLQYTTGCTADRQPVKLTVTTWPSDRARLADWLPG